MPPAYLLGSSNSAIKNLIQVKVDRYQLVEDSTIQMTLFLLESKYKYRKITQSFKVV
jgi:hypothetical protein